MKRAGLPLLAILLTAAMLGVGWGVGRMHKSEPATAAPAPAAVNGAFLFQSHCASCHGAQGHGDGATELRPPPRNFASRPWRFEPSIASIKRTTLEGIAGTGMPSFRDSLSPAELDALTTHVHHLATRGPAIEHVPSDQERLLKQAGFTNLGNADPPALKLAAADGKSMQLTNLRGKLVILHFWGTGCVHCIKEIPALNELEKTHASRIAVLHVCADEGDPATAQQTLHRLAPGTTSYSDPSGLGLARFEVQALPTVWLIAPTGEAIGRASGTRDWRSPELIQMIAHYLPASAQ